MSETGADQAIDSSSETGSTELSPLKVHEKFLNAVKDRDVAFSALAGNVLVLARHEAAQQTVEIATNVIQDGGNLKEAVEAAVSSGDPHAVVSTAVGVTLALGAPLVLYGREKVRRKLRDKKEGVN